MLGRPATPPQTSPSASFRNLSPCPAFRNLGPDHLAGVIFTCTDDSFDNCIEAGVFGLPRNHFQYVQYVRASMVLFLFNYNTRELHGIFRAVTQGKLDGRPGKVDSRWASSFPAQVYVDTSDRYQPLPEAAFKLAIMDNYHSNSSSQFAFELDTEQVAHISELFKKMNNTTRFSPPPQLSPLAHSPQQSPVNAFAFLEGTVSPQPQNAFWDGLPPQQNWNENDAITSNLQPWDQTLPGQTATNVAALSAQIAQESGLNYNQLPVQVPQQGSNVWPITGQTPGHQSPLSGTNLGGLDGWAQSPMQADTSPRSQVWANLGGPLSPVMALTPRAGTPGGSSTPTGVWGQQSIWSALPGDPFRGLSWTSGQTNVAPGAGLSLGNQEISTTGLTGSNPSVNESAVDRRGWGSLLDGSGSLVELKAPEGSPGSLAKDADKLITFGSLVAKEEDLEALIEADEEGEAGDTISFLAEATRGHTLGLYREGGMKEGWKDERDLVTHGWTESDPASMANGGVATEGESCQMEDKMLERISSLPRIKTGRDGGAGPGSELEKMIEAFTEMNGQQTQAEDRTNPLGQSNVPQAVTLGAAGTMHTLAGRPYAASGPSIQLPPKSAAVGREAIAEKACQIENKQRVSRVENSQESGVMAPGPTLDIYKNVINKLTTEVTTLKAEKTLLLKEKESIKGQLEQTNARLLLIQANRNEIPALGSKDGTLQGPVDDAGDGGPNVTQTVATVPEDLWIVGGVTTKQKVCRKADILKLQDSRWCNGHKVPMGLCYGAAVAHGSYIFILGGVDTNEPYGERANMWTINAVTGMISEAKSLLGPRTKLSAAKVDGRIYAIGGLNNSQSLQTVEVYDPMQDRWLLGPSLNDARRAFGTALADRVVYAVGGINKNTVVKTVEMMDTREGNWQVVGSIKEPRAALACAPLNGDLLVLGGYSDGQVLGSAEVFDVRGRKSVPAASMAQGRSYCTATCIENHIYVVGGRTSVSDDDSAMAEMECYSIKDSTWGYLPVSGQTELRAFHSACAVGWGGD